MKTTAAVLTMALLLCACTGGAVRGQPPSSAIGESQSPDASPISPPPAQPEPSYPKQAADYLKMSLEGSVLVSLNMAGKKQTLLLGRENYSEGQLSPDGKRLLCKVNAGGAGEASWCGYTTLSLANPADTTPHSEIQMGYQDHIWLDDALIGFASGSVIGGQEGTWKPVQLFDSSYAPLKIPFALPTKPEGKSQIVGIGYDGARAQFVLAHAENLAPPRDAFSVNRLLLSIFDQKGTWMDEIAVPQEYQSPYSGNIRALITHNPVVTAQGHILVCAERKEEAKAYDLLMISPDRQSTQILPYGHSVRLSADEKSAYVAAYDAENNILQPALLCVDEQGEIAVQELPRTLTADGYDGSFRLFDAAIRGEHVYIMARNDVGQKGSFTGLFYWDAKTSARAENIRLLDIFPGSDDCNLTGVDEAGACRILIRGAVPEAAEEDEDVYGQTLDRRERILDLIK